MARHPEKKKCSLTEAIYVTIVDWKTKWTFISSGMIGCGVEKSGVEHHGGEGEKKLTFTVDINVLHHFLVP